MKCERILLKIVKTTFNKRSSTWMMKTYTLSLSANSNHQYITETSDTPMPVGGCQVKDCWLRLPTVLNILIKQHL